MTVPKFMRRATLVVSTRRSPAAASGKISSPTTHLENVKVVPIVPASEATQRRYGLETLLDVYETFTAEHEHTDDGQQVTQVPDVVAGDKLVDGSTEYEVKQVADWPAVGEVGRFLHLILEAKAD
jgi:hypothetical protein